MGLGFVFVTFEEGGADDTPDNWGITAALTCAIDGECVAV
jgi:hypothetical protein